MIDAIPKHSIIRRLARFLTFREFLELERQRKRQAQSAVLIFSTSDTFAAAKPQSGGPTKMALDQMQG